MKIVLKKLLNQLVNSLKPNKPVLLAITVFDSRNGNKISGEKPKIVSDYLTDKTI